MEFRMTVKASSSEFIPVSRPQITDEECAAAERCIRSAWLSTGAEARAFEQDLADRFGSSVVAVSSASAGLMVALRALGVGSGDEVIVPAITFVATSNAALNIGAIPVFADIDPSTGLMSAPDAIARVTNRTRALIAVDLYGQRTDWSEYAELRSRRPDIGFIQDAAQSMGTVGVGGQDEVIEVFSFYATKNVTCGEGGAIVTRDAELASKMRVLTQQGVTADAYSRYHGRPLYDVTEIGFKANLPDVLAAIGRVQLRRVDEMQSRRAVICRRYQRELRDVRTISWDRPTNFHLYPIFSHNRDALRFALQERGIGSGIHFECIPSHTAYRRLGYDPAATPCAAAYGQAELTLPTYAGLSDNDQSRVISAVLELYGG
jgi:dTDP-4-amino-4,6-dideoxygalactose transaminase